MKRECSADRAGIVRAVQAGLSLVELMVALTISLLILASLVTLFTNTSRSSGEDFALDASRFLDTLRQEQPRLVFLAWPNNPTGNLFDPRGIEAILRACAGRDCHALVVVDEAYVHYSGQSFLPRLGEFPNLVILRTLSKIGLAGIRLGILIANADVVREVNKVRMPYNVNAISQAAARVVLAHGDVVAQQAAVIVRERERVLAPSGSCRACGLSPARRILS